MRERRTKPCWPRSECTGRGGVSVLATLGGLKLIPVSAVTKALSFRSAQMNPQAAARDWGFESDCRPGSWDRTSTHLSSFYWYWTPSYAGHCWTQVCHYGTHMKGEDGAGSKH